MESLRQLSHASVWWKQKRHGKFGYEPLRIPITPTEKNFPETYPDEGHETLNHTHPDSQSTNARHTLKIVVGVLSLLMWTPLVSCFSARNPHLLGRLSGVKTTLSDHYFGPLVPIEFKEDKRFVNDNPHGTPFWNPAHAENLTDDMSDNAWNYYGNSYIWLKKDSPFAHPGGRPLIPIHEKDAWMKGYMAYLPAYKHELHCVGSIKETITALYEGQNITDHQYRHANHHCLEILRHSVMCKPDMTLGISHFDETGHEVGIPYWGDHKHMCRDQSKVHAFFASRNMGFKENEEGGKIVMKAYTWPMPTDLGTVM